MKVSDEPDGMLALSLAVKAGKFPHTTDATIWVQEWMKTIKEHPEIPHDEGSMLAWFANAIMAGYDNATMVAMSVFDKKDGGSK